MTRFVTVLFNVPFAAFLAALSFAGCAASGGAARSAQTSAGPPASPGDAQSEISRLEQQIAHGRRALGLPARPTGKLQLQGDAARAESADQQAEPTTDSHVAPAPAPPSAPAAAPISKRSARPDPCRHARAICAAAERICSLADYLGEGDAHRRCSQAREDCAEARRVTGC